MTTLMSIGITKGSTPVNIETADETTLEVKVSVIIPVWNDAAQLEKCLRSLQDQTLPKEQFEVIVVDNGSTDESRTVAQRFDFVSLLHEQEPGSYAARNRGLASANGDYVAFTDSDCEASPEWLETGLRQAVAIDGLGVLAGHIDLAFEGINTNSAASIYESLFAFDQQRNVALGFAVTANWISPRDVLLSAGGFDVSLKSGGDSQLSKQIARDGYKLYYAANVLVRHPARGSTTELFAKKRRILGGNWTMTKRNALARFLGLQYLQLMETLSRSKRVALNSSLSLSARCRTLALVFSLWVVAFSEIIYLALGGSPRRR